MLYNFPTDKKFEQAVFGIPIFDKDTKSLRTRYVNSD